MTLLKRHLLRRDKIVSGIGEINVQNLKKDLDEIPKYRKKTKSSISKAENKTKHKHKYKECLLIYDGRPYKAHYCTICGKVKDWDICREKGEYGYWILPDELVFKRYKDLEQFVVDGLWRQQLNVPLFESEVEESIDNADARRRITELFNFNFNQAQAIIDMRVRFFNKTGRVKMQEELVKLLEEARPYEEWL